MKKLEVIKEELLYKETETKEKTLKNTETYLEKYTEYYKEVFGVEPMEAFNNIFKIKDYNLIEPRELTEAFKAFGIKENDKKLYWIGKLYCALPLPLGVLEVWDPTKKCIYYKNQVTNDILYIRPCYQYIEHLMNVARDMPIE